MGMKRNIHLGICLLLLITIGSCIDPVDLSLQEGALQQRLVVDGMITNEDGPIEVRLKKTADFARDSLLIVEDAEAFLLDEDGNRSKYTHIGGGVYQLTSASIDRSAGRSFQLEVFWQEKTYRSEAEKMPEAVPIDEVSYKVEVVDPDGYQFGRQPKNFVETYLTTTVADIDEGPYLRWSVFSTFIFIENDPPHPLIWPRTCYYKFKENEQELGLFNGDRFNLEKIDQQLITRLRLDWTFFQRKVITVNQWSMTKAALQYWEKVDAVSNQQGSIFDTPPAAIQGNMFNVNDPNELVLGFFSAASVTVNHEVSITRADLGRLFLQPLCQPDWYYLAQNIEAPPECYDCPGIFPNNLISRPDFWE